MRYGLEQFMPLAICLILGLLILSPSSKIVAQELDRLIGRWNLTIESQDGEFPSWLEVRKSGFRTLVGSFVGQFGSARPISKIEFDGERLSFSIPPQWERRQEDLVFKGRLKGDRLTGETTDAEGQVVRWSAQRAPALKRDHVPKWGISTDLFNRRDLSGWRPRFSNRENGWIVKEGILANANPGNDLVSERHFTDFRVTAEFRYPNGSNSGIYLRGRYEMQIEDNYGDEPDSHRIGGIYGFLTPSVNAAKPAGQWQTVEITLIGRVVTVILNGERVIDRQTIPGITGGAIDNNEAVPGPLMLQGDHGPIEFRKVVVTIPQE